MRTQEFNSKLISLLPLDEGPVHVPLRRPRLSRFERLPVPVWNPYSRGRLGPAKSEPKALEQVADRIVSGKPPHAQHPPQSRVGTQQSRVRKPRRAPATTDSKNAVKVCTGSILLAENSAETADPGQPLPDSQSTSETRRTPPARRTALPLRRVSRNSTFLPLQSAVICECTVLSSSAFLSSNSNLTELRQNSAA